MPDKKDGIKYEESWNRSQKFGKVLYNQCLPLYRFEFTDKTSNGQINQQKTANILHPEAIPLKK